MLVLISRGAAMGDATRLVEAAQDPFGDPDLVALGVLGEGRDPQPGLALLRLAEGRVAAAAAYAFEHGLASPARG
jgi:hypothetical protein